MDPHNTGVTAEAAAQTDQHVMQSEPHAEEQMVPLSALQAERRERQQLQDNMRVMQDHIALIQANSKAQSRQKEEFSDLSDHDVLTRGEARKFAQDLEKKQMMAVEELKMAQIHPDYNEVVRKYIPQVLKDDPDLEAAIMNAPNPYKVAYHLAKRSDQYLQDQRLVNRSPESVKASNNLQRAGNLSQAGHAASGSAASTYKTMSDKDFMALANRNLGCV